MNTNLYPALSWDEQNKLKQKTNNDWRSFISLKLQERDIRFLYVSEYFWEFLLQSEFMGAEWSSNPWKEKNAGYDFSMHHNDHGTLYIFGEWESTFYCDYSQTDNLSFDEIERDVFKKLIEEFGFYDFMMKMDASRWSIYDYSEHAL